MKQINSNIESFTKYIQSIQKYTEPMKILKDFTDSYKVFQNNINSSLLELNKTVYNTPQN